MVNYKRVVCDVAVLALMFSAVLGAPASECGDRHYDQRQNGSENYRLNIDGVVIAVAPAEALLAAASEIDLGDLLGDLDDFEEKPKPPAEPKPEVPLLDLKPQDLKPQDSKPLSAAVDPAKPLDSTSKPSDSASKSIQFPLSDVSLDDDKVQKKGTQKKHEKNHRFKNRLMSLLMPLLRKSRHE